MYLLQFTIPMHTGNTSNPSAGAFPWSGILNSTRATNWATAGFVIPNYTTLCATQPTLLTGGSNNNFNTAQINNSILSCDATHNVVKVSQTGTFFVAGINFGGKSNVVLRGNGAQNTYINLTPPTTGCYGFPSVGICMGGNATYAQSTTVLPGVGNNDCSWTSGYAKDSTTITLASCGNGPPIVGNSIVLDEPDPTSDNGGPWPCSTYNGTVNCAQKSVSSPNSNADGRIIGGVQFSQQQFTMVTSVTGTGPYTVTISPGVYFNNIVSGARAWWAPANVQHEGIEDFTFDHSSDATSNIGQLFIWCNQCWFQYNRSIKGLTNHTDAITSVQPVIQNNYFYGSQHSGSGSYCVEMEEVSGGLVQNNIMQNTTSPDIKDAVTGSVTAYNVTPFVNFGTYAQGLYAAHNSGSAFNLLEGNSAISIIADNVWGPSHLITVFRNHFVGWQLGYTQQTYPINVDGPDRVMNIVGNVLGEPGYHTQYEGYATSTTAGLHRAVHGGSTSAGSGTINQSIYAIGWTSNSGLGVCTVWPTCDPLSWTTLMRWKNYDTVDNAVISDTTEATPGAVTFVDATTTPSGTLPASFYLSSKPAWFGSLTYPPDGPDVTSGNSGICNGGSFPGVLAASSGQCTGGTFTASSWAGHANLNPAQNCYLNVMNGPVDGSGPVLTFNPTACGF